MLLCFSFAFAEVNASKDTQEKEGFIQERIKNIDLLLQNNVWLIAYQNYLTYQNIIKDLEAVDRQIQRLKRKKDTKSQEKLAQLLKEQDRLQKQAQLLKEYKESPFIGIVEPPKIQERPEVGNPFSIISAYSYIKQIEKEREDYQSKIDSLDRLLVALNDKLALLKNLQELDPVEKRQEHINQLEQDILAFNRANNLAQTTLSVYTKKIEQIKLELTEDIKKQMKRALNIAIFIVVVIVISLILKHIIKKYIKDNERFYMANKIINFVNFTLIALILLFAYIENVSYFVTILGFASAGIAIAMKDLFMSMLGWMVIVFGGSFHVGDRVKLQKDGLPYVGDIIDISLLRMTILEDITLTSYLENRRSGRIIFIPNNYVFTTLIASYTHGTLKTVWDGIDLTISFDSNHKKAMYLIKEITKKYSKGYTDIARRSLNQLRSQYSLKNTNVEPRIYSFLEPHGLTISTWYMTNSYAALTLRSTISSEIVDAIQKEDDIKIAYPTQTINVRHGSKFLPDDIDVNKDVLF